MRLPIALGLAWPDRVEGAVNPCDWSKAASWDFYPLDEDAFPAVALARRVGAAGSAFPAVFNAANEECVEAFLAGRIRFLDIVDTIDRVVEEWSVHAENDSSVLDVETVLSAEIWARQRAHEVLGLSGSETLVP
jgi:1-deoxy-D-xylulose-5-phosphate reductoisomerase